MPLATVLCLALAPQAATQELELTGPFVTWSNTEGFNVAVDGDRLAVSNGAFNAADIRIDLWSRAGLAWSLEATVAPPLAELTAAAELGDGLALSGDLLVAGAPRVDVSGVLGNDHGAAFVFRRVGGAWSYSEMVHSFVPGGRFGAAVAIDGDRVLVGEQNFGTLGDLRGAVHVYRDEAGSLKHVQTIEAPTGEDDFGSEITAEGDTLMVLSRVDGSFNLAADFYLWNGVAYAFQDQVLLSQGQQGVDLTDCDLDGDRAVISRFTSLSLASAWVLERDGSAWSEAQRIDGPQELLVANDYGFGFGGAVGVSGERVVVGAQDWYEGTHAELGRVVVYDDAFGAFGPRGDLRPLGLELENKPNLGKELALQGDELFVTVDSLPSMPNGGVLYYDLGAPLACGTSADTSVVSAATGGSQAISYDSCGRFPGTTWFLLGALDPGPGYTTGFGAGLFSFALDDPYFELVTKSLATLPGMSGVTDGAGVASGTVSLPPLDPSAIGLTVQHGFLFADLTQPPPAYFVGTSGTELLTITP